MPKQIMSHSLTRKPTFNAVGNGGFERLSGEPCVKRVMVRVRVRVMVTVRVTVKVKVNVRVMVIFKPSTYENRSSRPQTTSLRPGRCSRSYRILACFQPSNNLPSQRSSRPGTVGVLEALPWYTDVHSHQPRRPY